MGGGQGKDATRRAAVGRHSPVRCGRQRRFHGVHGVHRALRRALRDGGTDSGTAGRWGGTGNGRRENCGAAPPPNGAGRCGAPVGTAAIPPRPPPALGLGVLPSTAPPARACPAASRGGAPTRPQRCGTEPSWGEAPTPLPPPPHHHTHTVSPPQGSPPGDRIPQCHPLGSPLGTRQPPPPLLPSVTAGRGNPRGLPPPPGAAHPHPGYFPPPESSATLSVPPRPRAEVAGWGRLRAPRCQRCRGG